jgi:superfamily I DNA/RNA helicase
LGRLYRTQVLVDEATDFSPVQLACMATLARPGTRSFFACGDFNQRVTSWGTRSVEEMKWAVPDIEIKAVAIAYRQSRQLHDFARRIVGLAGADAADAVLPDYAENDGVPPVLAKGIADVPEIAAWLASRIGEIERSLRKLPSTAVFVNDEDAVRTIAAALGDVLSNQNIRVIPCPDGQVRGREDAVRVFNVRHIKGLEFEAVFFVGIDRLAELHPDLFDKYLYVGATRAATYLGLTCNQNLPRGMAGFEETFGWQWG